MKVRQDEDPRSKSFDLKTCSFLSELKPTFEALFPRYFSTFAYGLGTHLKPIGKVPAVAIGANI